MIKGFLRSLTIHVFALWLITENIGGINYSNEFRVLVLGAVALTLADSFLKPLINLFLLPFNLVTLGVFRWLSSALTLYISTLVVSGFSVVPFTYPGFSSSLFIIPEMQLSIIWAYIALSILTSFIVSLLFWLVK